MRRDGPRTSPIALLLSLPLAIPAAACDVPVPVRNVGLAGGFDFSDTEFEGALAYCSGGGPPARMWDVGPFGNWAASSSSAVCSEWLLNTATDLALPAGDPARWVSVHADWLDQPGCPGAGSGGISFETSFADGVREGAPEHRGLYAIATVGGCSFLLDLDTVNDGVGPFGNLVPVRAIPPVRLQSPFSTRQGAFHSIRLDVPEAPSYGRTPRAPLAGYRILYYPLGNGAPTSSVPFSYSEVLDPVTQLPLGIVPPGTQDLQVLTPALTAEHVYLVTLPIYEPWPAWSSERGSTVVSTHRSFTTGFFPILYPDVALTKTVSPAAAAPGDTVTWTLRVPPSMVRFENLRLWDAFDQMPEGCLDRASGRNLQCTGCDTSSYDPVRGRLTASAASTASLTLTIDFTVGPIANPDCRNVAWATAEHDGDVSSTASFENYGSAPALRRASVAAIDPRPDFASLFPLPSYLAPIPPLPFTDEVGLLSDLSRPLVLYALSEVSVIRLVKDLRPGIDSVVLDR